MIYGLTIGINQYARSPLKGCVADAMDMAEAFKEQHAQVVSLLDKDATRAAILTTKADMLASAGPDDLVLDHFSGHGTNVPDRDGDELDGVDEAIVPVDYATAGMIVDDELYRLYWPAVARGVRVVAWMDSCFSGSIQRFAGSLAEAVSDGEPVNPRKARWLPPGEWADWDDVEAMARAAQQPRAKPRTSALAFTACRADQVAYDAFLGGRYRGAFTAAALQAWDMLRLVAPSDKEPTYRQWYRQIQGLLPSEDFDQVPELWGTSAQKRWLVFDEHGRR
jgi:hypothetical protein